LGVWDTDEPAALGRPDVPPRNLRNARSILPDDGRVKAFMTGGRRVRRAAPALLDPPLALVERIDRWRRGICAVQPQALLGLEAERYRGEPVTLRDGTRVQRGDLLWTIHFDNARLRELAGEGWQTRAYVQANVDLARIAERVRVLPVGSRPVALTGVTLLASLTLRVGFEARERRPTRWVRLEDWYLRSLLARWSPQGRRRLSRGHRALRTRRVWLSTPQLLASYASPPPL
jgi:hypothetical protein